MPNRFRADLADVAWGKEHTYGIEPPISEMTALQVGNVDSNLATTTEVGMLRGGWGLVTGGIDLPTPSFDWQPFYGLGVVNRNMLFPIQGRETLAGRVPQALLCHDSSRLFLEQCVGLIFNGKNADAAYYAAITEAGYASNVTSGTSVITATTFTISGENFAAYKPADGSSPPTHIIIVNDVANTTPDRTQDTWAYIGYDSTATQISVYMDQALARAGWNGIRPPGGANTKFSIHGIQVGNNSLGVGASGVNSDSVKYVSRDNNINKLVMIRPTLVQPSFTLGARFRADDGSNFLTNYTGCKVSRFTLNFEEGAPVNYGADFLTRDMRHNIGEDSGLDTTGVETMKFKAAHSGAGAATGKTIPPNYMKNIRVTEQPYFFSAVNLTFQGVNIARFRRFTMTIDNQLDPRYYVTQNDGTSTRDNRQIIHEILEGRRSISFGGSLDLDDAGATDYPAASSPTDAQMLRYLLNQSMTSADIRDQNTLKGIGIVIELAKVSNFGTAASAYDKIKIRLPSNQGADDYGASGAEVGMVIRSAPLNIPAPPSIHIPMDIDGFCSSFHVELLDGCAITD